MKKAVVHIGLPKTATTSLQAYFQKNKNILYLKSREFNDICTQPIFEISKNQQPIFFSEENVSIIENGSISLKERIVNLKEEFKAYDTHILVTIREQREFLKSAYKDRVARNDVSLNFEQWLNSPNGINFMNLGLFNSLHEMLKIEFPNSKIHFLPYELLFDNNLKFLNYIYRVLELKSNGKELHHSKNKSLDYKTILLIKRFNKYKIFRRRSFLKRLENKFYKDLAILLSKYLKKQDLEFPKGNNNINKYLDKWKDENKKIARKFPINKIFKKFNYLE